MSVNLILNGIANPGLLNDLISDNNKDLNNWSKSGDPSITFSDDVNTIIYENNLKPTLQELFQQKTGYNLVTNTENTVTSYITSNKNSVIIFLKTAADRCQIWIGAEGTTYTGSFPILFKGPSRRLICLLSGSTIGEIQQDQTYSSDQTSANQSAYISVVQVGTYYDTNLGGSGGFEGYIDNDFTVEDGKKYCLKLDFNTPNGITINNNNVILTSGSNIANITFNNGAASENSKTYNKVIESDGTTLNIKFDLSTLIASEVVVNFSNIELYKLG